MIFEWTPMLWVHGFIIGLIAGSALMWILDSPLWARYWRKNKLDSKEIRKNG